MDFHVFIINIIYCDMFRFSRILAGLLMLLLCCVSFRYGNFNLFTLILQRGSIKRMVICFNKCDLILAMCRLAM